MLLIGPPGGGKTLALQRLPSLLPPLSAQRGDRGDPDRGRLRRERRAARLQRPFRAPHHTVSGRALVGGGAPPRPGEVTRAHRGVLFLDELGEFRRDALEALRVPLEEGVVTVTRTSGTVSLPCRFMLVAASNPCPCGNGPESGECDCHPGAVTRYLGEAQRRARGPDRHHAQRSSRRRPRSWSRRGRGLRDGAGAGRPSPQDSGGAPRSGPHERGHDAGRAAPPLRARAEGRRTLEDAHRQLGLSARGWDRCLRLARTIADLAGEDRIARSHVAEASTSAGGRDP